MIRAEASPRSAFELSALLVVFIALCDGFVGGEITFSLFYIIPVAVAAWYVGRWASYGISTASAISWMVNDAWLSGIDYSAEWIPYWNGGARLAIFLIIGTLLSRWKSAMISQRLVFAELDRVRLEKIVVQDQILSHVSHELRNPLAAASQFIGIVLDGLTGELRAQQKEYLEIAHRNVKQMGRMIGDLLEATRSESGKLPLSISRFGVEVLLRDIVASAQPSTAVAGLSIDLEVESSLPDVTADPARVRQVVSNLVENAIKFTAAGGRVVVRATPHDSEFLRISVEDTGRGIPHQEHERIFSRLYQSDPENSRNKHGLGIGLFLCREIVGRQGGRIWVDSEIGRGSTFHFTLPLFRDRPAAGEK